MKYLIIFLTLFSISAMAALPPTLSKGSGEASYSTTFRTNYGSIPVTRSGTTVTLGTPPLATTVTTIPTLSGEVSNTGNAVTLDNSSVLGKVLTGFTSGAGTVAGTDSLLQAIQKLDANDALDKTVSTKAQDGAAVSTSQIQTPYNQLTTTATGERLIETGNANVLVNPDFEGVASTVPDGWTCTTGTCTKTTTSGEFSSGKAAMKVVPTGNSFDVWQSSSLVAGTIKQHVVGINYRIPATCSGAVLRIYADTILQTTVPNSSLIIDDTFHTIEVPTVASSSIKLNPYAVTTCTGNSFFDMAYIKQGIGYQSLKLDDIYSARVSSAGSISGETKTGTFSLTSLTDTSLFTIALSGFTVTPNCFPSVGSATEVGANPTATIVSITSSSVVVRTGYSTTASSFTKYAYNFLLSCQKSGNDYLAASAAVYSQSSANYDWTSYTPTISGLGTGGVTQNTTFHRRSGDSVEIRGTFRKDGSAGTGATAVSVSLPAGLIIDTSKINTSTISDGIGVAWSFGVDTASQYITTSARYYDTTSFGFLDDGTADFLSGADFVASSYISYNVKVPIAGWSNSSSIVGSFAGYNSTKGIDNPKFCSFHVATGNTISKNFGGCAASSTGTTANAVLFTTGYWTTEPNCGCTVVAGGTGGCAVASLSTGGVTLYKTYAGSLTDVPVEVFCHGY